MRFGLPPVYVLVYVIIALSIIGMLWSGAAWYPWAPVALALAGAWVAVNPRSRAPGIVASMLWIVFAAIGGEHIKYPGPLGFGGYSALAVATTAAIAPKFARAMLLPIAFARTAWAASLARQVAYEIATVGHVTTVYDSCSAVFLPIFFAALLVFVFVSGGVVSVAIS